MVRGEVVRIAAPRRTRGHEQQGARPAVIVQSDDLLALSTVLVAPTSRSAPPATFRPVVELSGTPTRVLVDQVRALDAQSITGSLGRLSGEELQMLDDALGVVFGLRL
jgi:mRNA interferase MazF